MSNFQSVPEQRVWTQKKVIQASDLLLPPPGVSTIGFVPLSYLDIVLFGIPANHIILSVKIAVLVSFSVGSSNSLVAYVGNANVFPIPSSHTDVETLLTLIDNCYGVASLTIPASSDPTYQYGSYRWFTISSPGAATFGPHGSPTNGALCLPQRFDAHDVIARFVLLGPSGSITSPTTTPSLSLVLASAGAVEMSVQYCAI